MRCCNSCRRQSGAGFSNLPAYLSHNRRWVPMRAHKFRHSRSPLMSSVPKEQVLSVAEGVERFAGPFALQFGGDLRDVKFAWRAIGAECAPVVLALGGISAGRFVFPNSSAEQGWWKEVVGPGLALDANAFRILGIDFLGGSGDT